MGAKRVTSDEIIEMHSLFAKYGNYEDVGRRIGRSGTTVRKYFLLGLPANVQLAIQKRLKDNR